MCRRAAIAEQRADDLEKRCNVVEKRSEMNAVEILSKTDSYRLERDQCQGEASHLEAKLTKMKAKVQSLKHPSRCEPMPCAAQGGATRAGRGTDRSQ